jgi:LysR family transcriptional regulator, regulator of peptidoglycan recycling
MLSGASSTHTRPQIPQTASLPQGPLVFKTIDLILDAALNGLGLAYLPLDQVDRHISGKRLRRVLDKWTSPLPGYHLYYPSRHHNSPAFKLLVDTLRYRSTGSKSGSKNRNRSAQAKVP